MSSRNRAGTDMKRVGVFKEMSYLGPGTATDSRTVYRPRYEVPNSRAVQPFDSASSRQKGTFTRMSRAFEGEGGDVLHGDAMFRAKDREQSARRTKTRKNAWRPASASGLFSTFEYIPQGTESTKPRRRSVHESSKRNFVGGVTRRGNPNGPGALLQRREHEHFDDGYEQRERFARRLAREGLRCGWTEDAHKRAGKPAFKPTGNGSEQHDRAFLASVDNFGHEDKQATKLADLAELESRVKFQSRDKPVWHGTNTARDRYQRDLAKRPEHLPAGYELQVREQVTLETTGSRPRRFTTYPPWYRP